MMFSWPDPIPHADPEMRTGANARSGASLVGNSATGSSAGGGLGSRALTDTRLLEGGWNPGKCKH